MQKINKFIFNIIKKPNKKMSTKIVENYIFQEKIGEGEFSEVFKV